MPDAAIELKGFRELRRDCKAFSRDLPKQMTALVKEGVRPTVPVAAARAPRRTGKLAGSLRPFATAKRAGIRSNLPYATPIHWGWPRRNIVAQPFISEAIESRLDKIVDEIGDGIEDNLARKHGWR